MNIIGFQKKLGYYRILGKNVNILSIKIKPSNNNKIN